MPTQFDHLVPAELRAELQSADSQKRTSAVEKLVSAYNNGRRKKNRIPSPKDLADPATFDVRLLGLHWGATRYTPALSALLARHEQLKHTSIPATAEHLPAEEVEGLYRTMDVGLLEIIWEASRDSAALDALWEKDGTYGRPRAQDSVLAFRWWHARDTDSFDQLLRRLGLYVFVVPDRVERCLTADNQRRLLDFYGQIAVPPGWGTADEFAADCVAELIEKIQKYWNLRKYGSVKKPLRTWVRSRIADEARRRNLAQAFRYQSSMPAYRRNREAILRHPDVQPIKQTVVSTVDELVRLTNLVRSRAAQGALGWSHAELEELSHVNLRWLSVEPSPDRLREARERIADGTAGWATGAQPTVEEIQLVFGWFQEFDRRVAEQVVLRAQLAAALQVALPEDAAGQEVLKLRNDVLVEMQAAIDWVRDQRRYLERPVPKFAFLLAAAQELWWVVSQANAGRDRDEDLRKCRGLFDLFCHRYRAARRLASCYLLALALSHGRGKAVPSAAPGHPTLVDWLEQGRWRDNFELPRSGTTPYRAEDVHKGVVAWLEQYTFGPSDVRRDRLLLLAWLRAVPAGAEFAEETAALDTVYWCQIDSTNETRWSLLGLRRPVSAPDVWPQLSHVPLEEMVEAASRGNWLRVAELAAGASSRMESAGDRRWSPAVEVERAVRFLGEIHAERRQALYRCRELFDKLPVGVRGRLQRLGERLAEDTYWLAPSAREGTDWKTELASVAEAADVQCLLNLLSLWLSVCIQPGGRSRHRLADLDTLWGAVAVHKAGKWRELNGRVPDLIANAARGNWRAVARLAGNALHDVPDGSGPQASVFAALSRLTDGGGRTFAPRAEGGNHE